MRRLISLILVLSFLLASATPVFASDTLSVYYVGDPSSSVISALELAGFNLVEDPTQADVVLLNGEIPNADEIVAQIKTGKGLILIMGSKIRQR